MYESDFIEHLQNRLSVNLDFELSDNSKSELRTNPSEIRSISKCSEKYVGLIGPTCGRWLTADWWLIAHKSEK
jgi:hypothetical protein